MVAIDSCTTTNGGMNLIDYFYSNTTVEYGQPNTYTVAMPGGSHYTVGYEHISTDKINEERRNDMKGLYDVYLCYGEDRTKPIVSRKTDVVADGEEDAKIKSGLMSHISPEWDADYMTFIVRKIGDIKVKPKPSEVKSV